VQFHSLPFNPVMSRNPAKGLTEIFFSFFADEVSCFRLKKPM